MLSLLCKSQAELIDSKQSCSEILFDTETVEFYYSSKQNKSNTFEPPFQFLVPNPNTKRADVCRMLDIDLAPL